MLSSDTRSSKIKVVSLCVSRSAYVRISFWGSVVVDTRTGTMLDVAELYLVSACAITLRTSLVSPSPEAAKLLLEFPTGTWSLSMCRQVG